MLSDDEVIAERRGFDERAFLTASIDPQRAPRNAPALLAGLRLLNDKQWHPWNAVIAAGLRESDISVKTMDNLVRRAIAVNFLERRGEYIRGNRGRRSVDKRQVRLIAWPDNES